MSSFGTTTIQTLGRSVQVTADGTPRWKVAGITIDWTTVVAVTVAFTTPDGRAVPVGEKVIRYGTILQKITATGKYGPLNILAADGRQLVTLTVRGDIFILNETVFMSDLHSDHPAVFDGGRVFKDRLVIGAVNNPATSGDGTTAGTTFNLTETQFEAQFPAITFAND